MNDTLGVCIAQGIGDKPNGPERVCRILAAQDCNVRIAGVLKTVEGAIRVIMEFEHTHNVGVHQTAAKAPFSVQEISVSRVSQPFGSKEFQRYTGIGKAIAGQPDFRHPASSEPSNQRISAR